MLLRVLLTAGAGAMLLVALVVLGRNLATGQPALATSLLALVLGLSIAVVALAKNLRLLPLRSIELIVFGAVTIYLALASHTALASALAAGNGGDALSHWYVVLLQFVLLMGAYATFVPNVAWRAAVVVMAIAATPFAVAYVLASTASGPLIGTLMTPTQIAQSLGMVLIGATLSILGAFVTQKYFDTAYEAKAQTMYTLKEKIGSGGMGEVWLAEHTALARPAAIKLIRSDRLADGGEKPALALLRFQREAKATASLRSPHTIEIFDFGVTREGTFYYAMEHLEGLDLAQLVERHGPLPAGRVIHLLSQACDSLGDAHQRGMTHRDVKPANIFVGRMGLEHDFVKVLDFGLVKTQPTHDDATKLTMDGVASGTPGYMAPEMALDQGSVDGRADIYALGCVGYFLLTGKEVFDGDTPLSIIVQHVKTPPTPPSQRTELEIPSDLEAVIMRCLEKEADDRFRTAVDLLAALGTCSSAGDWTALHSAEWWKLHAPQLAA